MTNKVKVLIADDLAPGAADIFRNRGIEVDMKVGGFAGLIMGLFKKKFYRDLSYDFNGHISDLQDSLGAPREG